MAQGKRGPIAGTEEAKRGGRAMRDRYGTNFYRAIGKKGGTSVSARLGPEGYRTIGKLGGETTKAKYGADFYRRIGQIGGKAGRRPKPPDQIALTDAGQESKSDAT